MDSNYCGCGAVSSRPKTKKNSSYSTSTRETFDKSLRKAKHDWEAIQHSPAFY